MWKTPGRRRRRTRHRVRGPMSRRPAATLLAATPLATPALPVTPAGPHRPVPAHPAAPRRVLPSTVQTAPPRLRVAALPPEGTPTRPLPATTPTQTTIGDRRGTRTLPRWRKNLPWTGLPRPRREANRRQRRPLCPPRHPGPHRRPHPHRHQLRLPLGKPRSGLRVQKTAPTTPGPGLWNRPPASGLWGRKATWEPVPWRAEPARNPTTRPGQQVSRL